MSYQYVIRHPDQLSLLPLAGWEMSTGQTTVKLCGWKVKTDNDGSFHLWINVWVAGKTVWSRDYTCHTCMSALEMSRYNKALYKWGLFLLCFIGTPLGVAETTMVKPWWPCLRPQYFCVPRCRNSLKATYFQKRHDDRSGACVNLSPIDTRRFSVSSAMSLFCKRNVQNLYNNCDCMLASTWRLLAITSSTASTSIIAHTEAHGRSSTGVALSELVPGPTIWLSAGWFPTTPTVFAWPPTTGLVSAISATLPYRERSVLLNTWIFTININ